MTIFKPLCLIILTTLHVEEVYNNFYDQYINLEDLYAEIKLLGE